MQKITEIRETYSTKKRDRATGETISVTATRFRDVPYVDGWARFGHYLLDLVFFYIFIILIYFSIGAVAALLGALNAVIEHIDNYERLYNWLLLHPLFYFIFELGLQGSPAKAILGRVVVDEYGNKATTKQLFIRSISRAVPFYAFSCFNGTGWHDDWSNTFVIRKKDLKELQLLQKISEIEPVTVQNNDSNRQDTDQRRPT